MLRKTPVEFVPPGVTPEDARRQRKARRIGPDKRDVIILIVLVLLAIAFVGGIVWFFFFRGKATHAQEKAPVAAVSTATAAKLVTNRAGAPRAGVTKSDMFMIRWRDGNLSEHYNRIVPPTPTPTPTPTATPESSLFSSPVDTPAVVVSVPTGTPMPTATPEFDYMQISDDVTPSDELYSYVSGWIVERDGHTPRPVAVELIMPDGTTMRYPRPNNTDVANGHYEFLVSPGAYTLRVLDGRFQDVYFAVSDTPQRYEISFKYLGTRSIVAARSEPWSKYSPASVSAFSTPVTTSPIPTPTSTPARTFTLYLPLIFKSQPEKTQHVYLPLIAKNSGGIIGSAVFTTSEVAK